MVYGFIGAGNMVSAIVKGMANTFDPSKIYITSKSVTSAQKLADAVGANAVASAKEVIEKSDVIVLGVKPHILGQILPDLRADFDAKKTALVVSIAAGKTLDDLAVYFAPETPIVRVMPNINAKVLSSTTGFCVNANVTEEQKAELVRVFETIGTMTEIEEAHFSIFAALAGSSPAFTYIYLDALARSAVKAGLPMPKALEIISSATLGSAKMVLESDEHPWALANQVCSPGGTTIEGVAALQRNGFESTLTQAFDATLNKDAIVRQK